MSPRTHTVLVETVDQYDETGEPVPAASIAASLDVPETALDPALESLQACELLAGTDRGYRPTVTARELLALDVDPDHVLVLDLVEE
jgi:predicted transcriptional regulator